MKRIALKRRALVGAAVLFPALAGAQDFYYTGPYGAGGKWNLYQVVTVPATWINADTAARALMASSAPGVTGITTDASGHLVQISSQEENTFVCMIATATPSIGNSSVWIGLNDVAAETGGSRPGNRSSWTWSGTGVAADPGDDDILGVANFAAWAPLEPNDAGGNEDCAEMRTDGMWNDNNHTAAATTRRYVIEYDVLADNPLGGTAVHMPVYYTWKSGPDGKWNLYKVSFTTVTSDSTPPVTKLASWVNAHADATSLTANSTGLAPVAGNNITGHLVAVNSYREHAFVYRAMIFGAFNTQSTWIGLTDDPANAVGASEALYSQTSGWKWAGAPNPYDGSFHRFFSRPPNSNRDGTGLQPDNTNNLEHCVEMQGTGFWNDTNGNISGDTDGNNGTFAVRRYMVEWEIQSDTALNDPRIGKMDTPLLSPSSDRPLANVPTTTAWAIKEMRASDQATANTGFITNNVVNAMAVARGFVSPLPAGLTFTTTEGTSVNLNFNDGLHDYTVASPAASLIAGRGLTQIYHPDLPMLSNVHNVDDHHIVVNARVLISCLAGQTYTVNVHSDDGFIMRITGATFNRVTGIGHLDPGDVSTIYFPYGTGDSNTRGQFTVPADGDYEVEYLGWEGNGGAHWEVTWAQGAFDNDWDATFVLMGGPVPAPGANPGFNAPLFPPLGGLNVLPPGGPGWSVRAQYGAGTAGGNNVPYALHTLFQPGGGTITDVADTPVINWIDPQAIGTTRFFHGDTPFPGDTGANDDHYHLGGKFTWNVPAGVYTIGIRCSDIGALRVAGCQWRKITGNYANGNVDTYDVSTYWHPLTSGDSNMRGVLYVPTSGSHDVEFFFYTTTGNSNAEVYWTPGVALGEIDSSNWRLLGDNSGFVPALPPVIAGGYEGSTGMWGIHTVRSAGAISDLATAIAALQDGGAGIHEFGRAPYLNHIDPNYPGPSGIFGGDLTLPSDLSVPPKPSDPVGNDEDFAMHAQCRIAIPATGVYTFGVRASDGFAFRIRGQAWNVINSGSFSSRPVGRDPAALDTIFQPLANNGPVSELVCRANIMLQAGCHDVDFITFDRANDFHVEVFAAPGDFVFWPFNTEYMTDFFLGSAASAPWRLVGYRSATGTVGRLGIDGAGWNVAQSNPGTVVVNNIALAEDVFDGTPPAGVNVTNFTRDWINMRDPQNPTGQGGIINIGDQDIPRNTAADDNNYATKFTANLVVPVDGIYNLGWQGDDGGYLEIDPPVLPAGWTGFTQVNSSAILNTGTGQSFGIVTNALPDGSGAPNGRIQTNTGGGNTRTAGSIFLPAGTYPIRSLWFEGSGGSYFEIWASTSGVGGAQYQLLAKNAAATIADADGLAVVAQGLEITNLSRTPGGLQTITWASAPGQTYRVMGSDDYVSFTLVQTIPSGGFSTTWTESVASTRKFYQITKGP